MLIVSKVFKEWSDEQIFRIARTFGESFWVFSGSSFSACVPKAECRAEFGSTHALC